MKRTTFLTVCGVLATVAMTALAPISAFADGASRQQNKNQWRNLGFLGAAIAGYGLLEHNSTATVLGAAGAAYSADRYEQDRHSQDQNQRNRSWYYRGNGDNNGGNQGYYGSSDDYPSRSYDSNRDDSQLGNAWDKQRGERDDRGDNN